MWQHSSCHCEGWISICAFNRGHVIGKRGVDIKVIKDVHPLSRRHFGLLLFATDGGEGGK